MRWFRSELASLIKDELLSDKFVEEQRIFETSAIQNLKKQLFSNNPGDIQAQVWALVVFQSWWKRWL